MMMVSSICQASAGLPDASAEAVAEAMTVSHFYPLDNALLILDILRRIPRRSTHLRASNRGRSTVSRQSLPR
jgi:hypothetical protein